MLYSKIRQPQQYTPYDYQATCFTYPENIYTKLASLTFTKQWILFTSEAPRPNRIQLALLPIQSYQVIQLKKSHTLTEYEVAKKAILSENACALVLSNQFTATQRTQLKQLSLQHHCELFFDKRPRYQYH